MTDFTPDEPLKTFLGGRYAQQPDGNAASYMRHPVVFVGVTSSPLDTGVEGASVIPMPDYVHTASGSTVVWEEVTYKDDGNVFSRKIYYRDPTTGDSILTTSGQVGFNPTAASMVQMAGTFHYDVFADGADVTKTYAAILADAIAAGAFVVDKTGATTAVTTADLISKIDVDLKPVGGHGSIAGVQKTSTTSDATFTDGGGTTDIDPGGSRSSEGKLSGGFYTKCGFQSVLVKAGSIVTIAIDIVTVPA